MPSNLQFDLDYTKYDPNQTAIYYKYLEDRKVMITMPFRSFGSAVFGKLSIDQIILPYSKFTNAEMAFSGSTHGVGMNFTTYASFTPNVSPYTYSVLSLSYMFWAKIFTTGQMQYDFRQNRPDFVKISFEKHLLGNGYMNIAFQEYFNSNNMNALLGLRYDFSFARVSASALTGSNNTYSRVESASGSFLIDGKTNYFNVNNRSNVGKGGIVVVPYLDMNCNGIRDPDEPAAPSLKIHVNGGRTVYNNKDTTIRVSELEPYTNYYIDLDRNSFDNISWQLKKHTIKVTVIPNNFTEVDIPVAVEGEISGMVSIKEKGSKYAKGQGQIIVCIYNSDSTLFTRIVTESDGYFSYLGLPPGSYTVGPDTVQLRKLHFSVTPAFIPITILKSREGDVADNLEFKLRSDVAKRPEPSATDEPRQKKNNQDTTGNGNGIAENLNPKAVTQDTLTAGKSIEEVLKQKQTENDTSSNIEVVDYTTTVGHKVKNITTDTLNYRSHTTNAGPRNVKREEKINRENPLQKFVPPQDTKGDFKSMPAWKKLVRILYEDFIEFLSKLFK